MRSQVSHLTKMKDTFDYDKNTKLNAVMLLQRRTLQLQIEQYQNLLASTKESSIKANNEINQHVLTEKHFPNALMFRFDNGKKLIDDFEMILISILDADGKVATVTKLQDFMFIMTRIYKVYLYFNNLLKPCALGFDLIFIFL